MRPDKAPCIGIFTDRPRHLSTILDRFEQCAYETVIDSLEAFANPTVAAAFDVLLYVPPADETPATIRSHIAQHRLAVPVIVLMDAPTVELTVDLMQAGIFAVADWHHPERTLARVRDAVTHGPSPHHAHIYWQIVDQQTELICRYDADLRLLFVNRAYCEWQGLPAEELLGVSILEKIPHEDQEKALAHFQSLTADNPVAVSVHASRLPDGRVQSIEWTDRAILDADGHVTEYLGVGRDVTERNRAQAALRAAKQELEQRVKERTLALEQAKYRIEVIFNHSGDGIVLLDSDFCIEQSNYTFDEMFDSHHDTYFGASLLSLLPETDRPAVSKRLDMVVARHETHRMEIQATRRDGTIFDAEISIAPVNRSRKPVENIVCILRDISERKQAEAERQHYIAQIEDLYNNAPAGYHSLDENGVFVQINNTELSWLGYTRDEVIGKMRFIDLLTPESQAMFRVVFPRLKQTREISDIEFELIAKNGQTVWVMGSATVAYDANGQFERTRATLHNINDLKLAQNVLNEERNMLRTLIDAIPDSIYVKDRQHRIILNNIAHANFLGVLVTHVAEAQTYLERLPPDLAQQIQQDDARVYETGEARYNIENLVKRPDGSQQWVATTKIPLYNLENDVTGLVGISHDITQIKANQEALQASEARYRLLAENVTDMISRHTAAGVYTYVTPSSSTVVGYNPDELVGRSAYEFFHPDDLAAIEQSHSTITQNPTIYTVAYRLRRKDGQYQWVETTSHAITDADTGAITEIIAVTRDISTRKAAEDELRQLTERLKLATQAGGIGIWDRDVENNIEHWDEQMFKLYDIDIANGPPSFERWQKLVHPDDIGLTMADDAMLRGEKPYDVEFRIITPKGETRHIRSIATLYWDDEGRHQRSIGVNMDITRQKQAQDALESALEQERQLGELKSRFVSTASHQFRTPLAAILANTETLSVYRQRMTEAQIDTRLERIRKQVTYMQTLMEDVLNLDRIRAHQVPFAPVTGSLDALCREIIEDFAHQESYQNRIIYTGPAQPQKTCFDPHLLHHLLSNLVHNALKYSTQAVSVTLSHSAEGTVLRVSDKGIGIPEADQKHLFEPFFRASNVGTITGTGLGLSISKQVVEAHGGTLTLQSAANAGTTFIVELPHTIPEDTTHDEDTGH